MRRKIVRNKRPIVTGKLITLATLITVILGCISAIIICIVIGVAQYKAYKITWDSQNDCIRYMIRLGIERRDIGRSGTGCIILGETNEH